MRLSYYIFIIFPILSGIIACSPSRHLKENEYLLYKQSVTGNKKLSNESLVSIYQQKPNRRFLGFLPYVSIYHFGKKHFDTTKVQRDIISVQDKYRKRIAEEKDSTKRIKLVSKQDARLEKLYTKLREGNWLMRVPGEAPSLYDTAAINQTIRQMQYYLFAKGFYQGKVYTKSDTARKKIKVEYRISEGPAYKVNKITYEIEDPTIKEIVDRSAAASILKVNENYDEQKIAAERERLNKLMKDNGYFDFTRQFIFVEADSTEESQRVALYVIIKNPADGSPHIQYKISHIYFNTDVTNIPGEQRDTVFYRGKYYLFYKDNFSKRLLHYKTKLTAGDLYSQSNVQETQIQLASLDMYKFVNINFEKNHPDSAGNTLTAHIRTSPFKKYQISDEWGINVGQGFIPGPFGSITFKDRNVFRGFEIFEANIRYSLEAILAQQNTQEDYNTFIMKEYGGNLSLSFPQIFFPGLGRKARYYGPKTKVIAGYNFVDRPDFLRQTFRTALTYSWIRSINKHYNISLIDINLNQSDLDPVAEARLREFENRGYNLLISFRTSIVTSFNASYTYNNQQFGVVKRSKYWKPFIEIGGNIVNALSRYVTKEAANRFLGYQYFEFVKASSDLRYYFPVRSKNTLALRLNAGIALPYGSSAKDSLFVLPYEKYFFAGGSSSIRAWPPLRLGPGGYKDSLGYEQPGELLMIGNIEYRSNLFSFVDWAVFLDIGNVWTLKQNPTKPNAEFKFNTFLSQIAIGTGVGLRLNFTFLILRFDLGVKAWDPGEKGADRFALIKKPPFTKGSLPVLNIGIGYPF